jgi:hypothetical protein
MFIKSVFNNDISKWNVSKFKYMDNMFDKSEFNKDLSNWKPCKLNLEDSDTIFGHSNIQAPYWVNYKNKKERKKVIDSFHLHKNLQEELSINKVEQNKPKI